MQQRRFLQNLQQNLLVRKEFHEYLRHLLITQNHPYWKKELARLEPRLGRSRAIVRIARLLLVAVWHILSQEVADKHADVRSVAASLFAHAYKVKVRNLGGLSAKDWTRRELDRLGIGRELQEIPWGSRIVKLPPSSLK